MECATQVQMLSLLDENNVLSVFQSGFRKKHFTETTVVYLVVHILDHMNRQQLTGSAFIDLKKAFDLVDHHCLLHKLQHFGVRGRGLTCHKIFNIVNSLVDNLNAHQGNGTDE